MHQITKKNLVRIKEKKERKPCTFQIKMIIELKYYSELNLRLALLLGHDVLVHDGLGWSLHHRRIRHDHRNRQKEPPGKGQLIGMLFFIRIAKHLNKRTEFGCRSFEQFL